MAWRKWLVRSLVFSVLGLAVLAALVYEAWTNPAAVRRLVHDKIHKLFIGATVSIDSARLRLLGDIGLRDVRLARRDELDRGDFLYVPSAVIYHDKEHLLDGTLGVLKVELDRPRLRIVRERDGRINLAGLLAAPDLKERVPALNVRRGIIVVEDRRDTGSVVLLEIKDVNLTVVNDPLSTLVISGSGQTDALGPVRIHARFYRPSDAVSVVLELPEVPVGPPLLRRIAGFCPAVARHVCELSGVAHAQMTLTYRPGSGLAEPLSYDVKCELNKGELHSDCLPAPLEQMHAEMRCINGRVPYALMRARSGTAAVQFELWGLVWPARPPDSIEDIVTKLEAKVEHFPVTPSSFEQMSLKVQKIQKTYNPAGPVSLTYQFYRPDAEHWEKHWTIHPEGMSAEFENFRYPISDITGSLSVDLYSDRDDYIRIDLAGRGSDRPVVVRGHIQGDNDSEVDLLVAADDVPIDHKLMTALPPKSRELTRKFLPPASRDLGKPEQLHGLMQPAGLANIKVFIRRCRGQEAFANRYQIAFHDTSLRYDIFPYPLEKVTGVLDIQPDHWECRDFHGSHKGGEITVNGGSFHVDAGAGQKRECVNVFISGKDILLDPEFEQALSPPQVPERAALSHAWAMLALRGRLNFESVVVDLPDQPQDIEVQVDIRGCSMQPDFFRYAMSDVSARVRYKQGHVNVKDVSAKHGTCRLSMKEAVIVLKAAGGFTAWFFDICGANLLPDEEFLRALHPALRRGLEPLQIRKPLYVRAEKLTLDAPATPGEAMNIWWDGGASLRKQAFQAGVDISDVDGVIWCQGHYNGRQFEHVSGHAVLERATILGQPFTQLHGRLEVAPETPDCLSLYDLTAHLFGGSVGGEARFNFSSPMRYEVKLDALRVQLEQFGKHNQLGADAQLQGPARAAIHLTGEGTDLSGLRGNGRVEVAHGKMYRLPLLLGLLKAFGLRVPDQTAFEDASMLFGIEGPQMRIHSLNLYGNAISLRGQGTLNLDGSNLNLDFSADWGRVPQLLPPGIRDLSQALTDQLFKIKLRGKISSPRFEKEPIPGVVDPIKKVLGKP
ncbi:MAG TPA: AsmA-like C-terminal region-containing protein [Gemmataceae bacterium]|nr:AsmA-like C-terminal region-containing protein [Gemmataceae bacterium]